MANISEINGQQVDDEEYAKKKEALRRLKEALRDPEQRAAMLAAVDGTAENAAPNETEDLRSKVRRGMTGTLLESSEAFSEPAPAPVRPPVSNSLNSIRARLLEQHPELNDSPKELQAAVSSEYIARNKKYSPEEEAVSTERASWKQPEAAPAPATAKPEPAPEAVPAAGAKPKTETKKETEAPKRTEVGPLKAEIESAKIPDDQKDELRSRLDDLDREWKAAEAKFAKDKNSLDWGRVAEMLGRALTQVAAGAWGAKNNVDLSNLKGEKWDWKQDYDNIMEELKSGTTNVREKRDIESKKYAADMSERNATIRATAAEKGANIRAAAAESGANKRAQTAKEAQEGLDQRKSAQLLSTSYNDQAASLDTQANKILLNKDIKEYNPETIAGMVEGIPGVISEVKADVDHFIAFWKDKGVSREEASATLKRAATQVRNKAQRALGTAAPAQTGPAAKATPKEGDVGKTADGKRVVYRAARGGYVAE